MVVTEPLGELIIQLKERIEDGTFVKLSLSDYHGGEAELKNVYLRTVLIKRDVKLSFTYRYKRRDLVKNLSVPEGVDQILYLLSNGFRVANLLTTQYDLVFEQRFNKLPRLLRKPSSIQNKPGLQHDKEKNRLIKTDTTKSYLYELRITDEQGNVHKNAQNKYKQINHYIELLRPLIHEVGITQIQRVTDMGSGKGYLTFALYDYLTNELKQDSIEVVGVELRKDLVQLCNDIAKRSHFKLLKFEEGTIAAYHGVRPDLLIALHACDTATDDAICQGIQHGASLIVVAPCCHKQIRREMETARVSNELTVATRFGIFLERQAEMLTDALRALILEYFGYKTKVFEFISDSHTPKNVLIAGIKGPLPSAQRKAEIYKQIAQTKAYFGIKEHYLETQLPVVS